MTKEQVQAFLDELTALSHKHGIIIARYEEHCDWPCLVQIETDEGAYVAEDDDHMIARWVEWEPSRFGITRFG